MKNNSQSTDSTPQASDEASLTLPDKQHGMIGEAPSQAAIAHRRFGFSIGKYAFLLAEGIYSELLLNPVITPLPNAPKHVLGLLNLRGSVVPVYTLRNETEDSPTVTTRSMVLVIGKPDRSAALVVTSKPLRIDVQLLHRLLQPPLSLPPLLRDCADGFFEDAPRHWISLDHDLLFTRLASPQPFSDNHYPHYQAIGDQ